MIREISITNLGVIEQTTITLEPGLTVLTGETGAGKTLITTAVSQVLGAKSDPALVRSGCDEAVIDVVLDRPTDPGVLERLAEIGATVDDECIVTRTIGATTRSRVVIGGRAASSALLTELLGSECTLHGQHGQTRLTRSAEQRAIVDEAGGERLQTALRDYRAAWDHRRELLQRLEQAATADASRAARIAECTALIEAVEAVRPERGEDQQLTERIEQLARAEDIVRACAETHRLLAGDDALDAGDALTLLAAARRLLEPLSDQPTFAAAHEQLVEIAEAVAQVAHTLAAALDALDADEGALDVLQARRSQVTGLVRRWGTSLDAVLDAAEAAREELSTLTLDAAGLAALEAEAAAAHTALLAAGADLSARRRETAATLSAAVTREIHALGLANAEFDVDCQPLDVPAVHGLDAITFRFSANPGQALQPLATVGSGGELSRVMLALEVVAARNLPPHTFVFDEVDAGIGGAAALEVGRRLAELATTHQVLVVTHLAQVAAFGDQHIVVEKTATDGHTRTTARRVTGAAREREIARMLGGLADSDAATSHARELLAMGNARVE